MPTLHLTGPLGTKLTVDVEQNRVLDTLRHYGRSGWTSGELPAGGLVLPLAMEERFDWALIGARRYVNGDGEVAVMYRGQSYKRRDLPPVATRKLTLPGIVKYSRGARATDLPHLKEGEEGGGAQYVTLVSFRGGGRVVEAYLLPEVGAGRAVGAGQAAD